MINKYFFLILIKIKKTMYILVLKRQTGVICLMLSIGLRSMSESEIVLTPLYHFFLEVSFNPQQAVALRLGFLNLEQKFLILPFKD